MAQPEISFPSDAHDPLLEAERGAWFRHRNELIAGLVGRYAGPGPFYEIGAGNGAVSAYLQALGREVVAVEPLAAGAKNCRARGISTVHQATLGELRLPPQSLGAIGAFDVLEHLEHPELLVAEAHRVLKPNGVFIATVPAHQFLWSGVDEASGHFRRYSLRDFRALFEGACFATDEYGHFMNLLVVPAFISRVIPELLGGKQNSAEACASTREVLARSKTLELCLSLEKHLKLSRWLPFGTSLFGVFRREGTEEISAAL